MLSASACPNSDRDSAKTRREQMAEALASADASRSPKRRDLAVAVMQERLGEATTNPDADFGVHLSRAIYM
ncbi:hypothetical protein H6F61_17480 [Cyanobacteria bacterium FACHB-472]|nr:hypothetical protein [Cyanobacteria bacterium FACHB-472]